MKLYDLIGVRKKAKQLRCAVPESRDGKMNAAKRHNDPKAWRDFRLGSLDVLRGSACLRWIARLSRCSQFLAQAGNWFSHH
jgi:hypothetical protein